MIVTDYFSNTIFVTIGFALVINLNKSAKRNLRRIIVVSLKIKSSCLTILNDLNEMQCYITYECKVALSRTFTLWLCESAGSST